MPSSMLIRRDRPIITSGLPTFERPDSQLASASQIYEPSCRKWFDRIGFPLMLDRKAWEYAFILHAINTYAHVGHGARGLALGCGKEFIAAMLAADGAKILATDYVSDIEESKGWEARGLEDLYFAEHIDRETFDKRVRFEHADMNNLSSDYRDFDFLWSTGSLEHIGSHANGLRFVENAMDCLKPGGIAVHTTEFTLTSETMGRDYPDLSFYCRADIEGLATRLLAAGHMIVLNFDRGTTLADTHVDTPPYHGGRTLTAHFDSHIISSIGLIIQRAD